MGGKSTLHKKHVSSDDVTARDTFDLKSWQGLTSLLKAGKDALSPSAYGEFRNLVLQYTQQGGDPEFKRRIDEVVATFGQKGTAEPIPEAVLSVPVVEAPVEIPPVDAPAVAKDVYTHSTRRIQPKFETPVSVSQVPTKPVTEHAVKTIPEVPPQPEPVIDVPEIPVPEPTPVVVSESVVDTPVHVPPVSFITLEQCKVRIAEIKKAVNSHYGNPVALMALPHNVGKTYMTALLTALKVSGSGTPGSVDFAMAELERAYNALLGVDTIRAPEPVIESVPEVPPQPEPVIDVLEIPVPEPTPVVVSEPEHVIDLPVAKKHISSPPLLTMMPVSVKTNEVQTTQEVEPQTAQEMPEGAVSNIPSTKNASRVLEELRATLNALEQKKVSETNSPVSEQESSNEKSTISLISEDLHLAKEQQDTIPDVVETVTDTQGISLPSSKESETNDDSKNDNEPRFESSPSVYPATKIAPVTQEYIYRDNKYVNREIADTTTVKTLEKQGIKVSEISARQSELFSPQITTMLNSLLHGWSIFSGSGLFGTGPGGAEHPLYKVLAPLSVGEVVSGRWNRADPKVIKSITQYIDAWRHEQGITFSPSETFDHFLRRVVQRILKRQNL